MHASQNDRAKHNIQAPSKFGVVEMTRQRVRPETEINTNELCPSCGGTGEAQASILIIDEIETKLNNLLENTGNKVLSLHVHPFIEAYLRKGVKSIQRTWFLKYKKWIQIRGLTNLGILDYHFMNGDNKQIET